MLTGLSAGLHAFCYSTSSQVSQAQSKKRFHFRQNGIACLDVWGDPEASVIHFSGSSDCFFSSSPLTKRAVHFEGPKHPLSNLIIWPNKISDKQDISPAVISSVLKSSESKMSEMQQKQKLRREILGTCRHALIKLHVDISCIISSAWSFPFLIWYSEACLWSVFDSQDVGSVEM